MNVLFVFWVLAQILFVEGALMLVPAAVGFLFGQEQSALCYGAVALATMLFTAFSFLKKPKNKTVRAKEGLAIAGMGWLAVSLVGAVPLVLTGEAGFVDALFEIVSGFTTTGATIFSDVEGLCRATHFWRSFTHWIGGMGVLVFVMAILSLNEGQSMHIMRAEVPGHQAGKLVSKMKNNSRILYLIYIALTLVEFVLLLCGGMDVFDALLNSFSTAGTGGFGIKNASIAAYNSPYAEWVITVFMLLFSINFNLYYFILIGSFREALKSEELRWFGGIVGVAVTVITCNLLSVYGDFFTALRSASFTVASLVSTTGFTTANYDLWPDLSKVVLMSVMFIGACSGSTGGGIKVSRIVVMLKTALSQIRKQISPRSVQPVRFEGKTVEPSVQSGIMGYLALYIPVFLLSFALISVDRVNLGEALTSVSACLNNVGPGLGQVGPVGNYAALSELSKLVLSFDMLAGRLELFPMIALFAPALWRK